METLHTILLGPYKYLLRSLMGRQNSAVKAEIQARIRSLDFSGFEARLSYNVCRHFQLFIGRDFKALAQIALYLLTPYMTEQEKVVWLALSKVYIYIYNYIYSTIYTIIISICVQLVPH